MEGILLKDIVYDYPKELICKWDYVVINSNLVLYFKPMDNLEQHGFNFYCVSFVSCDVDEPDEWWVEPKSVCVERYCEGYALFDGIRHTWFGDDKGYLYYIEPLVIIKLMEALRKLELKHCSMPSKEVL